MSAAEYEHGDWCVQVIRPIEDPGDRLSTFLHNFECHDSRNIPAAAPVPSPEGLPDFPTKRWHVTVSGDWENGWEAEASGYVLGGDSWAAKTNDSGWFREPGGHESPEAALTELLHRIRLALAVGIGLRESDLVKGATASPLLDADLLGAAIFSEGNCGYASRRAPEIAAEYNRLALRLSDDSFEEERR